MTAQPGISQRFIPIIEVFSEKFHRNFLEEHRVGSPLGAWCLLAYIATNDENPNPEVTKSLGCTTREAKEILLALIKEKPAVIALAVNSWINPSVADTRPISSWTKDVAEIARPVASIPDAEELNEWVERETLGLISEFPATINRNDFLALFSTVAATEINWETPLKVMPNEDMEQAWNVRNFLVDKEARNAFIHNDSVHGNFAVHLGVAADGDLNVYSVIALDENVPEAATMAVARSIASGAYNPVKIQDLELGESKNGSLIVTERVSSFFDNTIRAYLPAWKSSNSFNLLDMNLGFRESIDRFKSIGGAIGLKVEAEQVSVAEYSTAGFKAAAVSHALVALRSSTAGTYKSRNVVVRFNQPYAVVASIDPYGTSSWRGIPVFDGWVTKANDIEVKPRGRRIS